MHLDGLIVPLVDDEGMDYFEEGGRADGPPRGGARSKPSPPSRRRNAREPRGGEASSTPPSGTDVDTDRCARPPHAIRTTTSATTTGVGVALHESVCRSFLVRDEADALAGPICTAWRHLRALRVGLGPMKRALLRYLLLKRGRRQRFEQSLKLWATLERRTRLEWEQLWQEGWLSLALKKAHHDEGMCRLRHESAQLVHMVVAAHAWLQMLQTSVRWSLRCGSGTTTMTPLPCGGEDPNDDRHFVGAGQSEGTASQPTHLRSGAVVEESGRPLPIGSCRRGDRIAHAEVGLMMQWDAIAKAEALQRLEIDLLRHRAVRVAPNVMAEWTEAVRVVVTWLQGRARADLFAEEDFLRWSLCESESTLRQKGFGRLVSDLAERHATASTK